jgi:hypothetical protein
MADTHCKTCGTVIPMPRIGQRYCAQNCKQAAYRNRSKRAVAVTRKRRLYPTTGCRNENTEFPHGNQRSFLPPTYCFVAPRSMPPKGKGMMPPGPPPPLSWIEIAILGGHVVKSNDAHAASALIFGLRLSIQAGSSTSSSAS